MHCGHHGEEKLMTIGIPFSVSDLIVFPSRVGCVNLPIVSSALSMAAKVITQKIVMTCTILVIFILILTSSINCSIKY